MNESEYTGDEGVQSPGVASGNAGTNPQIQQPQSGMAEQWNQSTEGTSPQKKQSRPTLIYVASIIAVIIIVAVILYAVGGIRTHTVTTTPTTTIPNSSKTAPFSSIVYAKVLNISNLASGAPNNYTFLYNNVTYNSSYKGYNHTVYRAMIGFGDLYRALLLNDSPPYMDNISLPPEMFYSSYPSVIKAAIYSFRNASAARSAYAAYFLPVNGTNFVYVASNSTILYSSINNITVPNASVLRTSNYSVLRVVGFVTPLFGNDSINGLPISSATFGPVYRNWELYQVSVPPYGNNILVINIYSKYGGFSMGTMQNITQRIYTAMKNNLG